MSDTIDILIRSRFDPKGATDAAKAIKALPPELLKSSQAAGKLAQAQAQLAAAQARAQQAAARTAQAQNQAAISAQRLATAQQQQAAAAARASSAQSKAAADLAKADAAQSRAAQSALRLQQAQAKAASGGASGFQRLASSMGAVQKAAGAVGVAFGAAQVVQFTGEAMRMAASLDTAKRALAALAGTPQLYADALATAREQQRLFGGSLEENISGIQGLITVSRSSGVELKKLVDITQRLSIKDPAQGVAGARIALNEALAGDPVSLAKRYEIPKAALAAIRDESTSAAEKLAVIDQYLNQIGITSEVASGSVSPLATNLNTLGASADNATAALGTLAGQGLGPAMQALSGMLDAVASGIGALTTIDEKVQSTQAAITAGAQGYDDYREKAAGVADQLRSVGVAFDPLTEAQFSFAQSLIASGMAADEAVKKVQGLGTGANVISNALAQLQAETGASDEQIRALGNSLMATATSSSQGATAAVQLADAYLAGGAGADYFTAGVGALAQESTLAANAAGLAAQREGERAAGTAQAADATYTLVDALKGAGGAGVAAQGGLIAAAAGADAVARSMSEATVQASLLLSLMGAVSGAQGEMGASGARAAGAGRTVGGIFGNRAAGAAAGQARTSAILGGARGIRGGVKPSAAGGGGSKVSEAEKIAEKLIEIEEDTARKLAEIDAKAAADRLKAQKALAASLQSAANDFAVQSQVNDLDFFGKDISDEQKKALADRERAEATARERQKAAIEEARKIAEEGDAELADATFSARQDQIKALQDLDETYYQKQREVGDDQQQALTTQYQEASAAIAGQTDDRITLAQAEAQARAQAVEDEKTAAVQAAADQASALLSTGTAATTAKGQVEALSGALSSLPTNVTTTVTIRTVNEGGGGSAASGGGSTKPAGGGSSTKAAGGGSFVTNGPAHFTVGDNPGGRELVQVTPLSGRGTTSVGAGVLRMAGGGSAIVDSAAASATARLNAGTTPTLATGKTKTKQLGGGASVTTESTDALEAQQKALQLMLEVLDLRERVLQVEDGAAAFGHTSDYANALRRLGDEAQFIAQVVKNRALPMAQAERDDLGRYLDVAKDAIDTLLAVIELRDKAKASGVEASKFGHDSEYANALRRLGDEAQFVAQVVANRMLKFTEVQADLLGRYTDAASASLGLLAEVSDLREQLTDPQPALNLEYVTALATEAGQVAGIVRSRLVSTTEDQAQALSRYAGAASESVDLVGTVADLREQLAEPQPPLPLVTVFELADEAMAVTKIVRGRLVPTTEEQADELSRYADAVSASVSVLSDAMDLSGKGFADYTSPSDAQLNLLAADAARTVDAVRRAAAVYDTAGLEAAKAFADAYGSTVSAFSDGLKFNEQLLFSPATAPDAGKLAQFEAGSRATIGVIERLGAVARAIPAADIAALQSTTAAITSQADAMIRLAAVPFADLPRIAGAFGGANTGTVGDTVNVTIMNPPAGMDVSAVVAQVKTALQSQIGTRR